MLERLEHRSDKPGELYAVLNGIRVEALDFGQIENGEFVIKPANFVICGKYKITCEEYYEIANDFKTIYDVLGGQ